MALTEEEYVAKAGNECPFCGSGEIEGQSVEVDAGSASQKVGCNSCGREWLDVYTLVGFQAKD